MTEVAAPTAAKRRAQWRIVAARAGTVLAAALLVAILIIPGELDHVSPALLLRIPVEALLGLALVLAVPARARRAAAAALGVLLGLFGVVRLVDIGFFATLDRPFDPVLDWGFLASGVTVLRSSMGAGRAVGVVIAAIVAALGVIALVTISTVRVSRLAAEHRRSTAVTVAVLGLAWAVCAATGIRVVADEPIAARDLLDRAGHVPVSLHDSDVFANAVAADSYRDTPGNQLLTRLRGKDVLLILVESYGRVSFENAEIAATVEPVLADGTRRLAAAGYGMRSGFLTSPTLGGGSWLASSTLLSGTWVDNQQRYESVAASDRLMLPAAFRRAGWRTAAIMPGTNDSWPEAPVYGYDQILGSHDMGYAGPVYSFDSIPDQYTLSVFQSRERAADSPVMAVVPLLSSHAPWSPVPALRDWSQLGNGSVFPKPTESLNPAEIILQRDATRVRADYAHAIGYTLSTIVSYVETYGDDNLVVLFAGDHQPAPVVVGDTEVHDTPITILARDPAVLSSIAGWGWSPGLRPADDAPVWRMDQFRDRFLAAFS